ncbi:hypothetical protein [Nonomuraea sp. GTA35]|uniref:hypothetical protein n=1 Tax=Nonomuraea sp. GTA35 TaxID=1676746 RepID=UPI0035C24FB5
MGAVLAAECDQGGEVVGGLAVVAGLEVSLVFLPPMRHLTSQDFAPFLTVRSMILATRAPVDVLLAW